MPARRSPTSIPWPHVKVLRNARKFHRRRKTRATPGTATSGHTTPRIDPPTAENRAKARSRPMARRALHSPTKRSMRAARTAVVHRQRTLAPFAVGGSRNGGSWSSGGYTEGRALGSGPSHHHTRRVRLVAKDARLSTSTTRVRIPYPPPTHGHTREHRSPGNPEQSSSPTRDVV